MNQPEQRYQQDEYIQAKAFVLSSITLSPFVWHVAFNLGVYGTIFYDEIFSIWAASLAALLSSWFLPRLKKDIFLFSWAGRVLLALPTLVVVVEVIFYGLDDFAMLRSLLSMAVALLSLPYILYFVIVALVPGTEQLDSKRLRYGLLVVAASIAALGYTVGKNHTLILTCDNFAVAGNKVPENCFDI